MGKRPTLSYTILLSPLIFLVLHHPFDTILSISCIVVTAYLCYQGPAEDQVVANLRNAFLEIVKEYKIYTEEERKKVVPFCVLKL